MTAAVRSSAVCTKSFVAACRRAERSNRPITAGKASRSDFGTVERLWPKTDSNESAREVPRGERVQYPRILQLANH